jgi:hypothetical protein
MFQFVNNQTNNCITMYDLNSAPTANTPRDLGAFSVNVRLQIWLVEGDAEGWYIIKSFPFGVALGTGSTPALMVGSNDGTSSYQWKFIQDAKATTVRCVNRRFPSYVLAALDGPGTLQLVLDGATPIQRYFYSKTRLFFPLTIYQMVNDSCFWRPARQAICARRVYHLSVFPTNCILCDYGCTAV